MKIMEIKIFDGKKIKIMELSKKDFKDVKKFQDFINSLIEEDAQIKVNKKISLNEEKEWLRGELKEIKKQRKVSLIAKDNNKIVGTTNIYLSPDRRRHIGNFGISIRKGYRRMGLGSYLVREIIN